MERVEYWAVDEQKIVRDLQTSLDHGLTSEQVQQKQAKYGPNQLTPPPPPSVWQIYLQQFKSSLIIVLLVSAAIIFGLYLFGHESTNLIEGSLVTIIIVLITLLGFFQEYRAERAISALKKMLTPQAKVVRDGKVQNIESKGLVPGDIVVLEEGAVVPADIRVLQSFELKVNESSLTGESTPVNKTTAALAATVTLAERTNMAYSSTTVTEGRAKGVVVEIGNQTQIGTIAKAVAEIEEESTPIQKRLDEVGGVLGKAVLVIAVLVFIFVVFFDREFTSKPIVERVIDSLLAAVALAVAAIPEGLPAVVTISFALGTQRLLKKKALLRKLSAAETLGSTDIICADKTGTLTKNQMTVTKIWVNQTEFDVSGAGYDLAGHIMHRGQVAESEEIKLLSKIGAHCNEATLDHLTGDPTELALLVLAKKAGQVAVGTRESERPFSSARRMMSVVVTENKENYMYVKGAPETVLALCRKVQTDGKTSELTASQKTATLKMVEEFSGQALRVLALAYKTVKSPKETKEDQLTFVGLTAMIDPLRDDVAMRVNQCREAGIRVVMITGDHLATAQAIGAQLGIDQAAVSGEQLDKLSDEEFGELVTKQNIYARVSPDFKLRIVKALQAKGHIVAMTGDGVNDAPALKQADIGVAMGLTGTDVAKEAADMVLLDDSFSTIVAAIEEGRAIFDNIRKFVNYLISCNIAEVLVVFFGVIFLRDIVLTAVMLLWINVVTDGLPAVALALDPPSEGTMQRQPSEFQGEVINKKLWLEMFIFGCFITLFVLWSYEKELVHSTNYARAAAFSAIIIFELVRLFNIRAKFPVKLSSNWWLILAAAVSLILQLIVIHTPIIANWFQLEPLDLADWLIIAAGAIGLGVLNRLYQRLFNSNTR